MSRILVSGLVNLETTCAVNRFPIDYAPIDYNFFGVNMGVAGVGYNLAKSLVTLGDQVDLAAMIGEDLPGRVILTELEACGVPTALVRKKLRQTPTSAILYDGDGRRRIYCDLKDIQETPYEFEHLDLTPYDLVAACNINFNRPLLWKAKEQGKKIATDVHVLWNPDDEYNRDFMACADILFLSDEALPKAPRDFLMDLENRYGNEIIVLGRGSQGALLYVRQEDRFYELPAHRPERIVNTAGAGDSLFSSFLCLYARNYAPAEALELAQDYAAHKIGFDGAANGFLSLEELLKNQR